MRRTERHGLPFVRHRLFLGMYDLGRAIEPAPRDAVEHAVARPLGRARVPIGPAELGRLRQRYQERCRAEREPPGLLAELSERRRANAFEIAAIRRERQIERK